MNTSFETSLQSYHVTQHSDTATAVRRLEDTMTATNSSEDLMLKVKTSEKNCARPSRQQRLHVRFCNDTRVMYIENALWQLSAKEKSHRWLCPADISKHKQDCQIQLKELQGSRGEQDDIFAYRGLELIHPTTIIKRQVLYQTCKTAVFEEQKKWYLSIKNGHDDEQTRNANNNNKDNNSDSKMRKMSKAIRKVYKGLVKDSMREALENAYMDEMIIQDYMATASSDQQKTSSQSPHASSVSSSRGRPTSKLLSQLTSSGRLTWVHNHHQQPEETRRRKNLIVRKLNTLLKSRRSNSSSTSSSSAGRRNKAVCSELSESDPSSELTLSSKGTTSAKSSHSRNSRTTTSSSIVTASSLVTASSIVSRNSMPSLATINQNSVTSDATSVVDSIVEGILDTLVLVEEESDEADTDSGNEQEVDKEKTSISVKRFQGGAHKSQQQLLNTKKQSKGEKINIDDGTLCTSTNSSMRLSIESQNEEDGVAVILDILEPIHPTNNQLSQTRGAIRTTNSDRPEGGEQQPRRRRDWGSGSSGASSDMSSPFNTKNTDQTPMVTCAPGLLRRNSNWETDDNVVSPPWKDITPMAFRPQRELSAGNSNSESLEEEEEEELDSSTIHSTSHHTETSSLIATTAAAVPPPSPIMKKSVWEQEVDVSSRSKDTSPMLLAPKRRTSFS